MQRTSFFSRALSLAALACAAVALVVDRLVLQPAQAVATNVKRIVKNVVEHALGLAVASDEGKAASVVSFVQAKAFMLRIAKRERPVVSQDWRMCPST